MKIMKNYVKMLIFHIFCHNILIFWRKKFFIIFSLLFLTDMVECICKSVVQTTILKQLIIFPLII